MTSKPFRKAARDTQDTAKEQPDTKPQPSAGKGMPARSPQAQEDRNDRPETQKDASAETSLELPHERDEDSDITSGQSSPLIEQARQDQARGLQDTSKAAETDRTYNKLRKP
jgi:hypothetical protein